MSNLFRCASALYGLFAMVVWANAQSYPPAWKSTASYAIGDQVQLNGNVLRATHAVSPGGFKYDDWELWEARANTVYVIGVGQTFATLDQAWAFVLNARIAEGAYLHLYISSAKGIYSETLPKTPFSLDHPFGASISIIGDGVGGVSFVSSGAANPGGFTIDSGHSFGTISGFQVDGPSSNASLSAVAFSLSGNASIASLSGLEIADWGQAVLADHDSTVYIDSQTTVANCQIESSNNSSVTLEYGWSCTRTNGNSNVLYALRGGSIYASGCHITDGFYGAVAQYGGIIDVSGGTITGCVDGVGATERGYVNAEKTKFSESITADIVVKSGGIVSAYSAVYGPVITGTNDGSYIETE